MIMKYFSLFSLTLGAMSIALPSNAQYPTSPINTEGCSPLCVKLDVGSANSNIDTFGINNGSSYNYNGSSGLRWQLGVTWRPNAPEVTQAEAEKVKQKLDDNRSLINALADAITQNKPELARGIAIILAPRLNYNDPKQLIAEIKEGTINIGEPTKQAMVDISRKPAKEKNITSSHIITESSPSY
jgi:hypothetical protein